MPYLIVAALLVLTRLPQLPLGEWLKAVQLQWPAILGTDITAKLEPLYLPGTIFVVTSLLAWPLHRIPASSYRRAWTLDVLTCRVRRQTLLDHPPVPPIRVALG